MDAVEQFMHSLAADTAELQRELPDADRVWLKAQWAAVQENEARRVRWRSLEEAVPLALSVAGIVALAAFAASALGPLEPLAIPGAQPLALVQPLVLLAIGLGLPLMVLGTES